MDGRHDIQHDTKEHDLAHSNHHASARHATTCHAAVCLHIASHAQHLETGEEWNREDARPV